MTVRVFSGECLSGAWLQGRARKRRAELRVLAVR
jgi:hypothetical protein